MAGLRLGIGLMWAAFWLVWLMAAFGAKRGTWSRRSFGMRIGIIVVLVAARPLYTRHSAEVHSWPVAIAGTVLFVAGLALALWARVCMGSNWGMPMTLKDEPQLVQSGPYHLIRHPIYSGLILAFIGSAMAVSVWVLVPAVLLSAYFLWSARTEEGILSEAMPTTYPEYMRRTKMLVPFLF